MPKTRVTYRVTVARTVEAVGRKAVVGVAETDLQFAEGYTARQRVRAIGDTAAQLSKKFIHVKTRPEEGGR